MPAVFDEVLDVLSDGKFHAFEDIQFKAARNLNETQVEAVLSFLERYGFVKRQRRTWSVRTREAKLQPEMLNFLKRIKELEDEEKAVAEAETT